MGILSSTTFVEPSYATPRLVTPMQKDARPDPNTLVNAGVRCGPPKDNPNANAIYQNTTVPSAVPNTGIAVAQQTKDILAGLTIGKDGVYMSHLNIQEAQSGILLASPQKVSSHLEQI